MAPDELDDFTAGILAPLRGADAAVPHGTEDRCLDHVERAITAQDFVELGTVVLVAEFLGPILDLFAFALGFDDGGDA